jgi:hypothetical protein
MVQGFVSTLGGGNGYLEVFFELVLPDEIIQATRSEAGIQDRIFVT